MKHTLYLASGSATRKELLATAQIPFVLVGHTADESVADLSKPLPEVVTWLAQLKMRHVQIPDGMFDGQIVFVLTADTLTLTERDGQPTLLGKPKNRADAVQMLKRSHTGATTGSAFCIQKRVWQQNAWHLLDEQTGYAQGWALIVIDGEWIDFYLDRIDYMSLSGAIKIRGLCEQFTHEIRGSYSAIMGLPMYQVKDTLLRMGFYE